MHRLVTYVINHTTNPAKSQSHRKKISILPKDVASVLIQLPNRGGESSRLSAKFHSTDLRGRGCRPLWANQIGFVNEFVCLTRKKMGDKLCDLCYTLICINICNQAARREYPSRTREALEKTEAQYGNCKDRSIF